MDQPALADSPAFLALASHYDEAREWQMRTLFAEQPDRFDRFSTESAGLLLDYSKNRINETTMQLLFQLARERGIERRRDAMFAGEKINTTEHRAVLHTVLRMPRDARLVVDGQDAIAEVHAVLDRIEAFVERVRAGQWLGCTGRPITD